MSAPIALDTDSIEALHEKLNACIKEHFPGYQAQGNKVMLEALNSMAVTVALLLTQTGPDRGAVEFFFTTVTDQVKAFIDARDALGEQEVAGHG